MSPKGQNYNLSHYFSIDRKEADYKKKQRCERQKDTQVRKNPGLGVRESVLSAKTTNKNQPVSIDKPVASTLQGEGESSEKSIIRHSK